MWMKIGIGFVAFLILCIAYEFSIAPLIDYMDDYLDVEHNAANSKKTGELESD